jgi:heme-degrading monooxygenase HmoA
MIAVIFESWPAPGKAEAYIKMGAALASRLAKVDGFISIERFRSVTDPEKLVALSFWRNEASVDAWRNLEVHRAVQREGREGIFANYRLRAAFVIRDYGMFEREQAPTDSLTAHSEARGAG